MDWTEFDQPTVMRRFQDIGRRIRNGELALGRGHYALPLAHGVMQAIHCGYDRIYAVELGVAGGKGLLELCRAAAFFREECDIDIQVWGLDNAAGLPPLLDHRDHPEIWQTGQFRLHDPDTLRAKLPPFAHLLIGDVGDTLAQLAHETYGARLAFAAIDLDFYSSTKRALPLFTLPPNCYVPAVPVYVDDIEVLLTYNPWCGEGAAIEEFNRSQDFRKIERKPQFDIHNFHVCHVLDHPIRTGAMKPRLRFEISKI
jgi:hypothetical protein